MKTVLIFVILFTAMFGYVLDTRARLRALETIVAYGTIPSPDFPDDPRLKDGPWWDRYF